LNIESSRIDTNFHEWNLGFWFRGKSGSVRKPRDMIIVVFEPIHRIPTLKKETKKIIREIRVNSCRFMLKRTPGIFMEIPAILLELP